jgi:hypothetical protein
MRELYDVKCPGCHKVVLKSPNNFDQAVVDIVAFHYIKCSSELRNK